MWAIFSPNCNVFIPSSISSFVMTVYCQVLKVRVRVKWLSDQMWYFFFSELCTLWLWLQFELSGHWHILYPSLNPQGINTVGASNAEPPALISPVMYQLDIVLKKGINLAIRDRGGRTWLSLMAFCSFKCSISSVDAFICNLSSKLDAVFGLTVAPRCQLWLALFNI